MNWKLVLSVLFSLSMFVSLAQKELFFPELDSIKINYRSDGVQLDSVDAFFTERPNLRPGAGFGALHERNLPENLFLSPSGLPYIISEKKITPKFTGLPYLGFQYAFGSKLTQNLNVEYQQFFKPNTHLHFRYNRSTSNGFIRNGNYKLNDVNLRFYHSEKRYATSIEGYYGAYNLSQNGGIATDTLIEDFGLEFTPINREDAKSKIRKLDLKWDNYFRLVGDSLVGFGMKTKHQYNLIGREFTEQLQDLSLVDTLYIDTNGNTRDQYQTAGLSNGAGVYFDSKYFKIDASLNHKYWRNQNLGTNRDTNEVFLHSNLWMALGENLTLHNAFYFNIIGATGEIKEYAKLKYQILNNLSLNAKLNFENLYPTPYQRHHVANYNKWKIDDLKMQQKLQVSGGLKYGDTSFIQANAIWTSINNGRYYIQNEWRQDTLKFVSVGAFQLKGGVNFGKWSFYPTVTVRFNSKDFNYQPLFSTLNRIAYSTKLFKAQKLGVAFGVDIGYETSYQFMEYNWALDLYEPIQTQMKTENLMQLNAFFTLSIDEFRFFLKAENISSFFQDQTTRIDTNYPIMPFLMRIGITWDFFN